MSHHLRFGVPYYFVVFAWRVNLEIVIAFVNAFCLAIGDAVDSLISLSLSSCNFSFVFFFLSFNTPIFIKIQIQDLCPKNIVTYH